MGWQQARSLAHNASVPITMCVLDTGATNFAGELIFADQRNFADGSGVLESIHESGSHGTIVSTVCCTTNNASGFAGVTNLNGNRTILHMYRISSNGQSASDFSILGALSQIYNDQTIPPCAINLSFNSYPNTINGRPEYQAVGQQLQQKGSMLFNSAGNNGGNDPTPAGSLGIIASIGTNGLRSGFSNFGPGIFRAALGEGCPGYQPGSGPNSATFASGTSLSCPNWCAAVAVVQAELPSTKRTAVIADQVILQTANTTSQGYKVPNLPAAVQAAHAVAP